MQYEFRGKTLGEAVRKAVRGYQKKEDFPVPFSRGFPFCKDLYEEIEREKDELAEVMDEIETFSDAEKRRLESLPNAAEAYGKLIFDLGVLAASLTGIGFSLRAIRLGRAIWASANEASLVGALTGANDLLNSYSDASDVWNASDLRRVVSRADAIKRDLDIKIENWENASCHLYVDESGNPTVDPNDHASIPR